MRCSSCDAEYPGERSACPECGSAAAAALAHRPGLPSLHGRETRAPDEAVLELEGRFIGPSVDGRGRYEVHDLLGRGGMGAVYSATDRSMGKRVALKVMLPSLLQDRRARERFLIEARIAQELSHPNILNVHAFERGEGLDLIVMELLVGRSLGAELADLRSSGRFLSLADVAKLGRQVAGALGQVHEHDAVHRDVKPDNVFLQEREGGWRAKLLDFGIVSPGERPGGAVTQGVGTAGYMSPEQLAGRPATARSDLYALGVVLYECLTGKLPGFGSSMPAQLRPEVPPEWDTLLKDLLQEDPARRFASAVELSQLLDSPALVGRRRALPKSRVFLGLVVAALSIVGAWYASGPEELSAVQQARPQPQAGAGQGQAGTTSESAELSSEEDRQGKESRSLEERRPASSAASHARRDEGPPVSEPDGNEAPGSPRVVEKPSRGLTPRQEKLPREAPWLKPPPSGRRGLVIVAPSAARQAHTLGRLLRDEGLHVERGALVDATSVVAGSPSVLHDSGLAGLVKSVVLLTSTVAAGPTEGYATRTARLRVSVEVIDTWTATSLDAFLVSATGVGFDDGQAEDLAWERAVAELASRLVDSLP